MAADMVPSKGWPHCCAICSRAPLSQAIDARRFVTSQLGAGPMVEIFVHKYGHLLDLMHCPHVPRHVPHGSTYYASEMSVDYLAAMLLHNSFPAAKEQGLRDNCNQLLSLVKCDYESKTREAHLPEGTAMSYRVFIRALFFRGYPAKTAPAAPPTAPAMTLSTGQAALRSVGFPPGTPYDNMSPFDMHKIAEQHGAPRFPPPAPPAPPADPWRL